MKNNPAAIKVTLEYLIMKHLKEMMYKIPSINSSATDDEVRVEFTLDNYFCKNVLVRTIKKWLKENSTLAEYDIDIVRQKHIEWHPVENPDYDYRIIIKEKGEE